MTGGRRAGRGISLALALALAVAAGSGIGGCLEEPVVAPAPTGPDPGGTSPTLARVVVLNGLSETLSSLDLASREMTVPAGVVGTWPNRLAAWPEGRALLVTASGDNSVQILEDRTLTVRREIDLGPGSNPWLAVVTGAREAVVTSWLAGEVRLLSLDRAVAVGRVPVRPGPEGVAIERGRAWIACTNFLGDEGEYGAGRVELLDLGTGSIRASIEVGANPQDVLVAPDGRVHVLCTGTYGGGPVPEEGSVHIIDPEAEARVAILALGGSPGRFSAAPDGTIWVAGYSGGVRRYDSAALALLPEPASPDLGAPGYSAIAVDATTGSVWTVNFDADLLVEIDPRSGSIADAWIVGDGPVDVLVSRPGG